MSKKTLIAVGAVVLLLVPVWLWVVAPRFGWLSADFSYRAGVESFDNFYDETAGDFKGEERTVTKFTYDVVNQADNVLTIKNVFDVRTVLGEPVFSVERDYGVDRRTGSHVAGAGDKDRQGYLFAPRGLGPGDGFTYWHVNYDNPAQMKFAGEEEVAGLKVFRFQSEGLTADQTQNLSFLPEVGTTRGVKLGVDLETWIEPVTGYLVKYEDHTLANYYDLATGEIIHPWNKFHNQYSEASIVRHAEAAQSMKWRYVGVTYGVAGGLIVIGIIFLLAGLKRSRS